MPDDNNITQPVPSPRVLDTPSQVETTLRTAGQRRINIIWEVTQACIAIFVTVSTLYVAAKLTLGDKASEASFLLLSNAFFLVIGFYFGRTNRQKVGGVTSPYDSFTR